MQILYSADYQLLKIKNELSTPPISIFYIIALSTAMFVSAYVALSCVKLLIDSYKVKMEA